MSARSIPTSRVTPAPKRTLDTAISNAYSRPFGFIGIGSMIEVGVRSYMP
jgi:hypothetical protein